MGVQVTLYDHEKNKGGSTEQYREVNLYWNYFYHVWMVYSLSPFANAVAFGTAAPTVTALTVTPTAATVKAGGTVQITTTVTGTGDPTSKCTFTLAGNTDPETVVSTMGKVILGSKEVGSLGTSNNQITVSATSVQDSSKTATCTITVG